MAAKPKLPPITDVVRWKHLSPQGQDTTNRIMGDFTETLGDRMRHKAGQLNKQADKAEAAGRTVAAAAPRSMATRLARVAEEVPNERLTMGQAAQRRVDAVKDATTKYAMPGESVPGAGWYFGKHQATVPPRANPEVAAVSSAAMSPANTPENETAAFHALHAAHQGGTVAFTPAVTKHLAGKGVTVPTEMRGQSVPFHQIPSEVVPKLTESDSRKHMVKNSSGVDWNGLGKAGPGSNLLKATKVYRGETSLDEAMSPTGAPKTKTYAENMAKAVPGTPVHQEYMERAAHIADVLKDKVHGGQGMFDLHGLRQSNEGLLSDRGPSVQDSWMHALSVGIKDPKNVKAAGDIAPSVKMAVDDQGVRVSAHPHPDVGRQALTHAWHEEATSQAAQKMGRDLGLNYPVPATLVQESAWTGVRRAAGADPEYNAMTREQKKNEALKPTQVVGQTSMFTRAQAGAAPKQTAAVVPIAAKRGRKAEFGASAGRARHQQLEAPGA